MGHAKRSGDLRRFIESGKKIIISTVQKFPHILDEIGGEHRGRRLGILTDEAHMSSRSPTGDRGAGEAHQPAILDGAAAASGTTSLRRLLPW